MMKIFLLAALALSCVYAQRIRYAGVNLASAEFRPEELPGVYNADYVYPDPDEVDYWVKKGMNIFRIPFLWERMQRTTGGPLDATELARLDNIVDYITNTKKVFVIIDPHNYARYFGRVVGSGSVPANVLSDFWIKLAVHYKSNTRVIFGLMNEPYDMDTEVWVSVANTVIAAIRETEATNMILVPGNAHTGAWSWENSYYGTPNANAMLSITDPGGNIAIEVHQYLDTDSSGTNENCVSETIGRERLRAFTNWCIDNGFKAFLGEFGGGTSKTCLNALDDMLKYVDSNLDVWIGWTYWAGGQWWPVNYFTRVTPLGGEDMPQTAVLVRHTPNSDDPDKALGSVVAVNSVLLVSSLFAALYALW